MPSKRGAWTAIEGKTTMDKRENFGTRLGFILVSAGCAVGLGNVWKFPYICGQNGGAAFIVLYLICLALLGWPILICEYAVGRASRHSTAKAFHVLEPKGTRWHRYRWFSVAGNYLLMMFYTMVCGWMINYALRMLTGNLKGKNPDEIANAFSNMLASPVQMTIFMVISVLIAFGICALGLKNGVERITKVMMLLLMCLMIVLAVHSLVLPNMREGLAFYLVPDLGKIAEIGFGNVLFAAMSHAFFTLSLGIGAMSIFGSYIGKEHSLLGESVRIVVLDTFVAITAGLIIFPACFTYGVDQTSGPSLIFITLPNIFANMAMGRLWGSLFFLFMAFAALSTVLAVFENIICCGMELTGWNRQKSSLVNFFLIIALSLPCVLGYNVWSGIQPLGAGSTVLDFEDFLVSNVLLPGGSLVYLLFCVTKWGWGFDKYVAEANKGKGLKFAKWLKPYFQFILPALIVVIFLQGLL